MPYPTEIDPVTASPPEKSEAISAYRQVKSCVPVLGLPLSPLTMDEALEACNSAIDRRERLLIGVLNAAKLVNLGRDDELHQSMLECDMILADGQSIVWASRLLRNPLPERIAGIDLFYSLLRNGSEKCRSVYLLGARQQVLDRVQSEISRRWPGIRIVGAHDGYFPTEQEASIAAEIRDAKPDMLFLAMTSPKKENFLARYGPSLNVPVVHGVGGSFDVLAGVTRRAPRLMQRAGLEWAFRLAQEPRRLGPRYFRTNVEFMKLLTRDLSENRYAESMVSR